MSHKNRKRELAFWAIPPEGTEERRKVNEYLKSLPGHEKMEDAAKAIGRVAWARVALQLESGAQLPLDEQIREYNCEYNNRLFSYSIHDMPASFNLMEAFSRFSPVPPYFALREERDHIFSLVDFLDYYTSSGHRDSVESIRDIMPDGVVFSFNVAGSSREFLVNTADDKDFGIVGVSMVRFGNEVNIMMLAGQVCDLGEITAGLTEVDFGQRNPSKVQIEIDKERKIEAVAIGCDSDLWKTVVLSRIDVESMTIDYRAVYQDIGPAYMGITGDIGECLDSDGNFISDEFESLAKEMIERIADYSALFEMCKTSLLLPKYFYDRETSATIERRVTEYGENKDSEKFKEIIVEAKNAERISVRDVLILGTESQNSPDSVSFLPPEIRVESSGYWKKLPLSSVGETKNGSPIHGRTWVHKHLSWVDRPGQDETVNAHRSNPLLTGSNPGYIYVMRSAAHQDDLFKVGLTRRTPRDRANELTRTTGSPDKFLVVQEWATADCVEAEKRIHEALDAYRINPRREFFRRQYMLIAETVTNIVEQINKEAQAGP